MNYLLNIWNLYTESTKTYTKRIQNVSFPYADFLQGRIDAIDGPVGLGFKKIVAIADLFPLK